MRRPWSGLLSALGAFRQATSVSGLVGSCACSVVHNARKRGPATTRARCRNVRAAAAVGLGWVDVFDPLGGRMVRADRDRTARAAHACASEAPRWRCEALSSLPIGVQVVARAQHGSGAMDG